MSDVGVRQRLPEFEIVVRHPGRRGPLGPYRLALAVGFALLVAGGALLEAARSGVGIDDALVHAGIAAAFIWVVSGIISRILAAGHSPASSRPQPTPATTTPTAGTTTTESTR